MTPDEFEAAGLYDPAAPHAVERLELLRFLSGLGVSIDEMVAEHEVLPRLAYVHILRPSSARIPANEAAARANITTDFVTRVWQASGFPDPGSGAVFDEEDVEVFDILRAGVELLGEDVVMDLVRVVGSAMAHVADAIVSSYLVNVGGPAYLDDPVGLRLAQVNVASMQMLPALTRSMDVLLRRHIEARERPLEDLTRAGQGHDSQDLAVAFADLVNSTAFTRRLEPIQLGEALASFERRAVKIVTAGGGRVVKLIGDEVMFVTPDPVAACGIALDLVDAFDSDPLLPPVCAGVAYGSILPREGDYFGPAVNLAARATKHAPPSTVLADTTVGGRIEPTERLAVEPFGEVALKGFDEPVKLIRVTRR